MNCKNCEIKKAKKYSKYTSGDFCSKKCSRQFSGNINKKYSLKKEASKKTCDFNKIKNGFNYTKDYIRLIKCISCKKEMEKVGRVKYCKECKVFCKYKKLFKKLNIFDTNLCNANQKALNFLIKEYFVNKKSSEDIKKEFNIMNNTLWFFFKKNGIKFRNLSKSNKLSIEQGKIKPPKNNIYKSGCHLTWYGENIYYRSSYEKRLLNILDLKKEYYLYEKIKIKYELKGEKKTYIADFYLPERNLIIETKGEWFEKKDKNKLIKIEKKVLESGYYFILMNDKKIKQLEKSVDLNKLKIKII